ncbi:DUF1707 domain-containing protein [Actinoplanes sp. NPDC051346]|uniref:DUF1707 SHOCT-like domain-containing protein n=1 Tax=Actinoplanes sp. NPDC051346 TaxID=3155048 RepID=UPI0034487494
MAGEGMRAGDADREAVAERLRTALNEGRLDLHEYDERLQAVYAAKTYGDLFGLTTDLPGTIPAQRAQLVPQPPEPEPTSGHVHHGPHGERHIHHGKSHGKKSKADGAPWVSSYGGVVLVCVVVWAMSSMASGHWQYFWPGWMLIPLIFGIIGRSTGRKG